MKKIIKSLVLLILSINVLSACSSNQQFRNNDPNTLGAAYTDAYANINPEDIMEIVSNADIGGNPSNSQEMFNISTDVVLATITSIDGSSNINEFTGDYTYVRTNGNLIVNTVYKGNLEEKTEIKYTRNGGIISYHNYFNSLNSRQKAKRENQFSIIPAYVKMTFGNDIDIEVGKTYLVYMIESETRKNAYAIIGWEGGLREIKNNDSLSRTSTSSIEVYNNYTDSWEYLENIIYD